MKKEYFILGIFLFFASIFCVGALLQVSGRYVITGSLRYGGGNELPFILDTKTGAVWVFDTSKNFEYRRIPYSYYQKGKLIKTLLPEQ